MGSQNKDVFYLPRLVLGVTILGYFKFAWVVDN